MTTSSKQPEEQFELADDPRDYSILGWLDKYQIKNEKGDLITFEDHLFLLDIYEDQSQNLVVTKAAQVGLSTLEILKNFYDAHRQKMDIIYTLPTDSDVNVFVGGKVNRMIANNPILADWASDKDSVEQKQVGQSMVYFRGTWSKKAANMVSADRLVHDEKDASKQEVVSDYQARMQHSKFKQTHVFSHPSVENTGVDVEWKLSDQKEWFITCGGCGFEQYMSWNTEDPRKMSIDMERRMFVCKRCRKELTHMERAVGRWIKRFTKKLPNGKPVTYSGYHISLLMAPWMTAGEIIDKFLDPKQSPEYFHNKVLGLTYTGSGNVVTYDKIARIIDPQPNPKPGRLVIGVDPGAKLRYVVGDNTGLMGYGIMDDYMTDDINQLPMDRTLEYFLIKFPDSIMVIDSGGDMGQKKLRQKYPGRVFLCYYVRDRKALELIRWGKGDETGRVLVDRNKMMQMVIDELVDRRFKLWGFKEAEWYDYWLHWSHIYRIKEEDEVGTEQWIWKRSDRDDFVHCTVYWRIGVSRFGSTGGIMMPRGEGKPNSYMVNPDRTVDFSPDEFFQAGEFANDEDEVDWRSA